MRITFHKLNERQCSSLALRDDGVTVRVPGYGPIEPLPHDLAHVVVEREFGMGRGFWGSVAAGAMFSGMEWVSGRRKPHATRTGAAVVKENGALVGMTEVIVGVFVERMHRGPPPRAEGLQRMIASFRKPNQPRPFPLDEDIVALVWGSLQATVAEWRAVPVGGTFALEWTPPVERSPGRTVRDRRRGTSRVQVPSAPGR